MNREMTIERAAQARDLLNATVVDEAFAVLRERHIQALISNAPGTLTAQDAHASIRVLEQVRMQLKSFDTDEKMLPKTKKDT